MIAAPISAAEALPCTVLTPEVTVAMDPGPVALNHSASRTSMHERFKDRAMGEHFVVSGLYVPIYRSNLRWEFQRGQIGGRDCFNITKVTLNITGERVIYIPREFAKNSCRYQVVLAHEQEHARIDERLLARYELRFRQTLELAVTRPVTEEGELKALAEENIGRVWKAFEADRHAANAHLDSEENYRKESRACPRS